MSGNALRIVQAVYGSGEGYGATGGASRSSGQGTAISGGVTGSETPSFGVKGREPLTQDMFEYKGQTLTKEETRRKSYEDVYRHEAAHKAAGGKYAGAINIDFDGNGFATSGHVNIAMPTLDRNNLDETIAHATTVIASAEAPASFDELSDADRQVAAQARAIKAQALAMKGNQSANGQKHINYMA